MNTDTALIAAASADRLQEADAERHRRNLEKLRNELGSVICEALDDPGIVEIMVNPDGRVWLDHTRLGMKRAGTKISPARRMAALGTIAAMLDTKINTSSPLLEGVLPLDGSRVEGTVPPVSGPGITIRKHASAVFPLTRYVEEKRIPAEWGVYLREAIETRKNILVAGGTGSGKTTFVNALLDALNGLHPEDRLVVLEDTPELMYSMENVYPLSTDEKSEVTMQLLVKTSLRLRPDRIVVGEVRGKEALDLLKSWNTGHPGGISTLHANSAASALIRLEQLISEASVSPMKELIGEAVDLVVFLQRRAGKGPAVTEILEVKGVNAKTGVYDCVFRYQARQLKKLKKSESRMRAERKREPGGTHENHEYRGKRHREQEGGFRASDGADAARPAAQHRGGHRRGHVHRSAPLGENSVGHRILPDRPGGAGAVPRHGGGRNRSPDVRRGHGGLGSVGGVRGSGRGHSRRRRKPHHSSGRHRRSGLRNAKIQTGKGVSGGPVKIAQRLNELCPPEF
jgi:type IV secretion system protein VirB11